MSRINSVAAALGVLAVALPGLAWAHATPTAASVKTHVRAADEALSATGALAGKGKDAKAQRLFRAGRVQLREGQAEAAALVRGADSAPERTVAAQAVALVAGERDRWIEVLPALLEEVDGRFELGAAAALSADVDGRAAAVGMLVSLLDQGLPAKAEQEAARALFELTRGRDEEIAAILETLASDDVAAAVETRLLGCLEQIVQEQAEAAELLASVADEVSAQAAAILERATEQIAAEQRAVYEALLAGGGTLDPDGRAALEQIARRAAPTAADGDVQPPLAGPGSGDGTGVEGQRESGSGSETGNETGGSVPPAEGQPEGGSSSGGEQPAGGGGYSSR